MDSGELLGAYQELISELEAAAPREGTPGRKALQCLLKAAHILEQEPTRQGAENALFVLESYRIKSRDWGSELFRRLSDLSVRTEAYGQSLNR